jgi:signal transduction histidine kinase
VRVLREQSSKWPARTLCLGKGKNPQLPSGLLSEVFKKDGLLRQASAALQTLLQPHKLMLESQEWLAEWRKETRRRLLFAARGGSLMIVIVMFLHYVLIDYPLQLPPSLNWLLFRVTVALAFSITFVLTLRKGVTTQRVQLAFAASGLIFGVLQSYSLIWDERTPVIFVVFIPIVIGSFLAYYPLWAVGYVLSSFALTALIIENPIQMGYFHTYALGSVFILFLILMHHRQKAEAFVLMKRNERYLEEQRRLLQYSSGLVRILCHDLANSVGSILNCSELMQREFSKPAMNQHTVQRVMAIIERAGLKQKALIDNVRHKVALQTGKKSLALQPVELISCLREAISSSQQLLQKKRLKINLSLSAQEPVWVRAEPVSLATNVIENLLSNAIKFSYEGAAIDIMVTDEAPDEVALEIRDYGIGMPAEMLSNLFVPDFVSSRLGTQGEKGTGFGMLIVEEIIHQYGAQISVTSSSVEEHPEDHGTCIKIIFQKKSAAS